MRAARCFGCSCQLRAAPPQERCESVPLPQAIWPTSARSHTPPTTHSRARASERHPPCTTPTSLWATIVHRCCTLHVHPRYRPDRTPCKWWHACRVRVANRRRATALGDGVGGGEWCQRAPNRRTSRRGPGRRGGKATEAALLRHGTPLGHRNRRPTNENKAARCISAHSTLTSGTHVPDALAADMRVLLTNPTKGMEPVCAMRATSTHIDTGMGGYASDGAKLVYWLAPWPGTLPDRVLPSASPNSGRPAASTHPAEVGWFTPRTTGTQRISPPAGLTSEASKRTRSARHA